MRKRNHYRPRYSKNMHNAMTELHKPVKSVLTERCFMCSGLGWDEYSDHTGEPCRTCDGTGFIEVINGG